MPRPKGSGNKPKTTLVPVALITKVLQPQLSIQVDTEMAEMIFKLAEMSNVTLNGIDVVIPKPAPKRVEEEEEEEEEEEKPDDEPIVPKKTFNYGSGSS